MPNIILGIDPGIADTGYGVIENTSGKLKCLAYGSIKTKAHETLSSRLLILNQELEKIILKYRPQRVAIEKLFFNKNVKTALIVGQARGVVMLTISKHNLPICEYTPSQIKQAVSSYGQADKKQVQKMVKLILNLEEIPRPDDAADALAAAICALNYNNL
ncbi:MAG: crossover junction endodeoxyribonuclease RuvC [Patescibacteria group bacterium]|nr:crossover junction endodeoxyribonuclease RuvC [Patescibacteria group bacterium]